MGEKLEMGGNYDKGILLERYNFLKDNFHLFIKFVPFFKYKNSIRIIIEDIYKAIIFPLYSKNSFLDNAIDCDTHFTSFYYL